jgi:hypothetical protein
MNRTTLQPEPRGVARLYPIPLVEFNGERSVCGPMPCRETRVTARRPAK